MTRADELLHSVTEALLQRAHRDVRQVMESRTLRRALNFRIERPSPRIALGFLFVPHYWAVYYHDGRQGITSKRKLLVYFQNIEDDPRISGTASGERHADRKRLMLSQARFQELVKAGKLIVRSSVGPTQRKPFFLRLTNFQARARPIVSRQFSRFIRRSLADQDALKFRKTVKIPIRL